METNLTIPLSYLLSVSQEGLQDFEMKRLAYAANLEKEAKAILQEAQHERDAAHVAQWLRENREEILTTAGSWLSRVDGERIESAANAASQPVADRPAAQRPIKGVVTNAA